MHSEVISAVSITDRGCVKTRALTGRAKSRPSRSAQDRHSASWEVFDLPGNCAFAGFSHSLRPAADSGHQIGADIERNPGGTRHTRSRGVLGHAVQGRCMPVAERLLDLAAGIGLLVQGRADKQWHPPCLRRADFLGDCVCSGLARDNARIAGN